MKNEKLRAKNKNVGAILIARKIRKNNKNSVMAERASTYGITLISLVITIIILIILAGVAINLTLGENGIFRRAKEARDKYLASAEDEQKALNELYKELGIENLPENTKDTVAGTEVRLPEKWTTTTPAYISTQDGSIVKKIAKTSNVIAVATGKRRNCTSTKRLLLCRWNNSYRSSNIR